MIIIIKITAAGLFKYVTFLLLPGIKGLKARLFQRRVENIIRHVLLDLPWYWFNYKS